MFKGFTPADVSGQNQAENRMTGYARSRRWERMTQVYPGTGDFWESTSALLSLPICEAMNQHEYA